MSRPSRRLYCRAIFVLSTTLASPLCAEEEVAFRGAISIALRLVDPLCELVKVPPPSLGVGMYQHDIKEKVLEKRLGTVVEEVVSEVGAC